MAYINTIDYADASGELRKIYDNLVATRGKLADIHTLQSLNPQTIVSHMVLYKDIMFAASPLARYQREMIAVVVSAANRCNYCIGHHREALYHFWKDYALIDRLLAETGPEGVYGPDLALCLYARDLTLRPAASSPQQIAALRDSGFDDRGILDATLVISYFNFVNRMAQALGLDIQGGEEKGYRY